MAEEAGVRLECCEFMKLALDHATRQWNKDRPPPAVGLNVKRMYNLRTFEFTRAVLIYSIPAYGSVKERKTKNEHKEKHIAINFCPFCGEKQNQVVAAPEEAGVGTSQEPVETASP